MKLTKEEREAATEALKFDALAEAENITGKSYKEDKGTEGLGMLMHLHSVQSKRELLEELGDTTFSMKLGDYLKVVTEYGFKVVYVEDFKYVEDYGEKREREESLYILLHEEYGIVIKFDTYNKTSVNGGKMYYNIEMDEDKEWYTHKVISSGHLLKDTNIWVGDHDCREGVITNIENLLSMGQFLPVWEESPIIWFTTFADHKQGSSGLDYLDEISEGRFKKLPNELKSVIGKSNRMKEKETA